MSNNNPELMLKCKPLRPHAEQHRLFFQPTRFKVVPAGRRSGKCLAQDTSIVMSDGSIKNVQDVVVGDYVVSMNEDTLELESKKVLYSVSNGLKPVIEVQTRTGRLVCTTNHSIFTGRGWVEAGDLLEDDLIAVPKKIPFGNDVCDTDQLSVLSIWLAEGSHYGISNQTPEIIDVFVNAVKKWGLNHYTDGVCGHGFFNGKQRGSYKGSQNPLRLYLESVGLWGKNSKTKFIPDFVFTLKKELIALFLNLFMACDGWIDKNGGYGVGLANRRMVRQLYYLFRKFGVRGCFGDNKIAKFNGKEFYGYAGFCGSIKEDIEIIHDEIGILSKETNLEKVYIKAIKSKGSSNTNLIPIQYEDFVSHLVYEKTDRSEHSIKGFRKAPNAKIWDAPKELLTLLNGWRKQTRSRISTYSLKRLLPYSDGFFDKYLDGDIFWEPVRFIKPVKDSPTYDLTIEDNHNFIAGGIITHNSECAKRFLLSRAIEPYSYGLPFPVDLSIGNPRYFFAAPTWAQAQSIYWDDILSMIPDGAFKRERHKSIWKSKLTIDLKWSTVCVVGLDKPERIEGTPWDGGILDEYANMKPDVWNLHVRPSLSDRNGWAWFIGVPEGRNHYYDMFEQAKSIATQARAEGRIPEWDGFHWKSADILPASEIEAARRDLDDLSYMQEYEANFVSFHGKAYYPFNPLVHASTPLVYNPRHDLIFCFDFNVNPGVAVVCQEQPMPGQFQWVEHNGQYFQEPIWGTGVIGEVHIPRNSNTPAVCNRLLQDWGEHEGRIICYGDATGGSKGTSQIAGSDWDLVKDSFKNKWNDNVFYRVPKSNPRERVRVNSVNSRMLSKSGIVRLMVDPTKAPNLIRDFEGVRLLEGGSGEIDKRYDERLSHLSDSIGYFVVHEHPIMSTEVYSRELLI